VREVLLLIGGPQDGHQFPIDRGVVPEEWHIPIEPDVFLNADPDDMAPLRVGVYRPRLDEEYVHFRDDAGRLVYDWKGIR
jgi:hypothetical protein